MKKILFALLCCFVLINSVNAYTTTSKYTYTTSQFTTTAINNTGARLTDNSGYQETCTRDSSNNFGVNKKWDMTNKSRQQYALSTPCVDVKDKVYDFSDILTSEEEIAIKATMESYSDKYHMDIIFVSYNLPYHIDKDNEDWLADFYDFNDFGLEYEKYDGIAIFRNTYDLNPYYQILSFGETQMYLYDSRYDHIVEKVGSYFRAKNYTGAVDKILSYYDSCYYKGPLKGYYIDDMGYIKRKWYPHWFVYTLFGIIVGLIYMSSGLRKHKMVKKATAAREYFMKDTLNLTTQNDRFLNSHTSSYTVSSSSGGGGGHSSGGGHSGGGHSGGGGHG